MANKRIKGRYVILALILVFGIFLRLYLIDKNSFWIDETATAIAVTEYSSSELLYNSLFNGKVTPGYFIEGTTDLPFYYFILSFWTKLFDVSEISLRLFSAVFGSLSIIIVYLVAKELSNNKIALLSSFIFSLSMANIQYSQEARLYSLLVFISLSSVYFFIKSIETGKLTYLSLLVILNVIGLYTHFVYVFFMLFQGVYALIMFKISPKFVKHILISLILTGLTYIPMLPRLFSQSSGAGSYISNPTFTSFAKFWFMFNTWIYPTMELQNNIHTRVFSQFATLDWLLIISAFLLVFLLTSFFILGASRIIHKSSLWERISAKFFKHFKSNLVEKKWTIFLLVWFFIPFLSEFFLSILHPTATLFGPVKFLLFIFPAYIIIVSIGVFSLRLRHVKIFMALFVIFSLLPLTSYYSNINKQEWEKAISFIKKNIKENEIILINSPTMDAAFDYYYGVPNNLKPVQDISQATLITANQESLWLILTFDKYSDPEGTIISFLENKYNADKEKVFFDIRIFHFTKKT